MFQQSEISKRVLSIYNYLEKNGFIESAAEFCDRISYHQISFAEVKAGKRNFPNGKLEDLVSAFYVNKDYLLLEKGEMFSINLDIINRIRVSNIQTITIKNKIILKYYDNKQLKILEFILNEKN